MEVVSCRSMVPLTEEDIFELPIENLYARLELEALQTEATQSLPEIPTEPMEASPLPEIPTEPKEATQSLREICAEPKEAIQSLLEIPAEPKEATQSLEIPAEPNEATQSLEIPAEPKEATQPLLEIPAEPKEATQSSLEMRFRLNLSEWPSLYRVHPRAVRPGRANRFSRLPSRKFQPTTQRDEPISFNCWHLLKRSGLQR